MPSTSPAAESTLRILTLLARNAEPVPAGLISAQLGLPRSTTYRLLATLTEQGFVAYLPEARRYGLGVAAFELGAGYTRQMPLQRVAQPIVSRLAASAKENAHLAVLHGTDVYYVIEERFPARAPLVSEVGVRLPATLTATGLAILARLSSRQVTAIFPRPDVLVQREGRGPDTLVGLRRMLAEARQRGYAVEDGLITPGLSSIGAAVRDHSGTPVAAVSVTFESARIDAADWDRLVGQVQAAVAALSHRLGA